MLIFIFQLYFLCLIGQFQIVKIVKRQLPIQFMRQGRILIFNAHVPILSQLHVLRIAATDFLIWILIPLETEVLIHFLIFVRGRSVEHVIVNLSASLRHFKLQIAVTKLL